MRKVIPPIKVSEIPFFEGKISREEKRKYGMIMSNGQDNYYRICKAKGQGGNRKEETFDKNLGARGGHKCCGSKVEWRHKTSCPRLAF